VTDTKVMIDMGPLKARYEGQELSLESEFD